MPLYEYRCEACGAKEEKLQGFSAPTAHDCPACGGGGAMRREISRTAFVLAGSGWYAGGYAGGGKDPAGDGKAGKSAAGAQEGGTAAGAAPAAGAAAGAASGSNAGCASGCACHSPKIEAATKPE
ncbi:MAG: zinc ribbon domain-containing protein [Holophagaceae bacterium]|nr:zinc ribbon domain-containing protein [Holophagaceae bacterium]